MCLPMILRSTIAMNVLDQTVHYCTLLYSIVHMYEYGQYSTPLEFEEKEREKENETLKEKKD